MSDIAKSLFESDPKGWFDGYSSLEELNEDMGCLEGPLHGYLFILNEQDMDFVAEKINSSIENSDNENLLIDIGKKVESYMIDRPLFSN